MGPAKLRKLILVGALLEQKDKGAEADRPCDESLERVLIGDVANSRGCQVDHLYMLLQDLAIDKIDADEEKVPVEKSKHWQSLVLFPVPLELFDRTSKDTWIISGWHTPVNSGPSLAAIWQAWIRKRMDFWADGSGKPGTLSGPIRCELFSRREWSGRHTPRISLNIPTLMQTTNIKTHTWPHCSGVGKTSLSNTGGTFRAIWAMEEIAH